MIWKPTYWIHRRCRPENFPGIERRVYLSVGLVTSSPVTATHEPRRLVQSSGTSVLAPQKQWLWRIQVVAGSSNDATFGGSWDQQRRCIENVHAGGSGQSWSSPGSGFKDHPISQEKLMVHHGNRLQGKDRSRAREFRRIKLGAWVQARLIQPSSNTTLRPTAGRS